jgi:hypothetical protein
LKFLDIAICLEKKLAHNLPSMIYLVIKTETSIQKNHLACKFWLQEK